MTRGLCLRAHYKWNSTTSFLLLPSALRHPSGANHGKLNKTAVTGIRRTGSSRYAEGDSPAIPFNLIDVHPAPPHTYHCSSDSLGAWGAA